MTKTDMLKLMGKDLSGCAEEIGITVQAISDWPEELSTKLRDRVQAAIARRHMPDFMIGEKTARPVDTSSTDAG